MKKPRRQPEQKARNGGARKSNRQKASKLKQQKSTSVASSCSSSGPTQLIKGGKSLPANMPKNAKRQSKHRWTEDEHKQLWRFAKELSALWPTKMIFYDELSKKMNEENQQNEGYVMLDAIKVKDKFATFKGRYEQCIKGKFSKGDTLYDQYGDTMSSFFTSGPGASSSSVSAGWLGKTKKKISTKEDHASALKHLISNGIDDEILTSYSEILRSADVLDPFFQFSDFERQKNFLNACLGAQAGSNVPPGM